MFSDLQSKISKDRDKKKASDSRSVRSSFTAGSMIGSNESLTSLNSASTNRKSDRIRYLEGKVSELGVLLRQKSAFIESSAKEIDRLKAQLGRDNVVPENVLFGLQPNHVDEKFENHPDLSSMLNKAEANLAAVNRLSEEVIAQKEELHRKASMELESVKLKLAKAEEEVHSLRAQLAEKLTENEHLLRQISQVSKEMEVKDVALEDAKDIRSKMLSDHSAKDEALKRLEVEKSAAEKKSKELSSELEKVRGALAAQERASAKASDAVRAAQAEVERAASKARSAEVRAVEREADLKDRIRFLEERLVLLTEPDSALFSEQMGETKFSTSSIPSEESPEPAAARCATLLVERKLLETRLSETRKHLEDVKSTWNEKFTAYESQIAHLNEKISEDASEFAAERAQWEISRQQLELELSKARTKWTEAESAASLATSKFTEIERAIEEERREWQLTRASLEAKIFALRENAELESHTHAEALQNSHELQSQVSTLATEVESRVKEIDQLKHEKKELLSHISELKQEARVRTEKFDELNRDKAGLQKELQSRISTLEKDLAESVKNTGLLIQEKEELKADLQLHRNSLEKELEAATKKIGTLTAEKDAQLQELKSKLSALEKNVEASDKSADALKSEKVRLHQELQQRISTLESDVQESVKEAEKLRRENEELRVHLEARTTEAVQLKETNFKRESSTQQTNEKVLKMEQEMSSLKNRNEELRAELENLKQVNKAESTQSAELREKLAKSVVELQAFLDKFAESQQAAQSAHLECLKLEEERDSLHKKITEMEKSFADRIAEIETNQKGEASAEVATLKASIDELNEVIFGQNKTIRLQKQKLSELKKALGQGLRQVTASNLSLTDEEVQTHFQQRHRNLYSVGGSSGAGATAGGNGEFSLAVDEATLPPLFALSQQTTSTAPPPLTSSLSSRLHPPPAILPEVLPISAELTMAEAATPRNFTALSPNSVSTSSAATANSQYETDAINFEYTRHVLLKFLLSHDAEALQLVRAVATVLRLSKKDEFLIRQKLEDRRSWFATPVVAAKSSGQFAKMVPPP